MLLTEFNEKEYIENVKKEEFENGKTAGIEIGKSEGQLLLMRKLISQGKISSEEGARILNVDENILQ